MGSAGQPNLTNHPPPHIDTSYDYFDSTPPEVLLLLLRFQTFLPPLLIVLGTLGNLSSLLTLHRPSLSRHSISLYLSAYLLSSTVYLYAGCGLDWLSHMTGLPNVSHLADWTCRIWKFVFGVVRHSVDWLLVAMVTDRTLSTRRALATYRSALCTPFVARVAIIGVFIGLTVVAIHAMWVYGLAKGVDGSCGIDEGQQDLGSIAWPWLSAVTLSYLPNAIVLLLTPLLTVQHLGGRLCRHRKKTTGDVESAVNRNDDDDSSIQSGFTLCCICTSFTFLLCTVPANLVNILWYVNPPDVLTLYASFVICSMVTCVQSSVTFVWCYLCVRNVRTEFLAMLGEICERCSSWRRRVEESYAGVIVVGHEEQAKNTDGTLV